MKTNKTGLNQKDNKTQSTPSESQVDLPVTGTDEGSDNDLDDEGEDSDITIEETALLEQAEENPDDSDDEIQRRATLDNTDDDGALLNEQVDNTGSDLDVPGSEDDDDNEDIGEEDEENNSYSLGGDRD